MNSAWAGANGQIQTMFPKLSMATVTLYTHPAYLGLNKTSQRMPPMDAMGMLSTYPPPLCKLPPLAIPPPTRETVTSMFF